MQARDSQIAELARDGAFRSKDRVESHESWSSAMVCGSSSSKWIGEQRNIVPSGRRFLSPGCEQADGQAADVAVKRQLQVPGPWVPIT